MNALFWGNFCGVMNILGLLVKVVPIWPLGIVFRGDLFTTWSPPGRKKRGLLNVEDEGVVPPEEGDGGCCITRLFTGKVNLGGESPET